MQAQDPVRVSYTGADGKLHVNDSFDPGKIDELFAEYDIDIYRGGAQSVWAEYDGSNYGVATGTGKLVVRAVEDSENSRNPVISVVAEVTRPVVSGFRRRLRAGWHDLYAQRHHRPGKGRRRRPAV